MAGKVVRDKKLGEYENKNYYFLWWSDKRHFPCNSLGLTDEDNSVSRTDNFVNREIKFDVTWSYVKRQTAKMKLLPSVFSSLNSRVKIFVFVVISKRHFSIFMWFNEGLEEKNANSEVIFAVCRLT